MKYCILSALLLASTCFAQVNAASCNTTDVQTAINTATEGQTVTVPSGTCTWTTGVTISGKGITITGAGSGRIIAYDNGTSSVTVGTGTKTWTILGYSPGFSSSSITNGETLKIFATNNDSNFMQGTVTSLSSGTLTMNITSTGGSGSFHRWLVSTLPSTTIIANNASGALFAITEDTSVHTNWSGFKIQAGSGDAQYIAPTFNSSGVPILIHDCWMQDTGGSLDNIDSETTRGVVWNCSFDGDSGNNGQLVTNSAVRIKIDSPGTGQDAWNHTSYWGTVDTGEVNNFYVETNDFHAFQAASDLDSNSRTVWRYNLMDMSTLATHGADTSNYGMRTIEYYNNTGNMNRYSDGSTFNMPNGWVGIFRGGTIIMHDNILPALTGGSDYSSWPDLDPTVMNLQRNAGPHPCWGQSTSAGANYPAPRQIGFGNVTGSGSATGHQNGAGNCGSTGYNSGTGIFSASSDGCTYVGDSEPVYIWNNTRTSGGALTALTVGISDYGSSSGDSCSGSTYDSSANYFQSGRDYFNTTATAKPGYTAAAYPNPLTQSASPAPPSSLSGVVISGGSLH